jgi:hypothetical protein
MYALLDCWYEGDSFLVIDSLIAIADKPEPLVAYATQWHEERFLGMAHPYPLTVFMPGETIPNDGGYIDRRARVRIVELELAGGSPGVQYLPKRQSDTTRDDD